MLLGVRKYVDWQTMLKAPNAHKICSETKEIYQIFFVFRAALAVLGGYHKQE
jgi:hypothetical protein